MKRLRSICTQLYKHHQLILRCLLAWGVFLLATYRMAETGQPIIFNDEIGYWSNCNFFLGKNWIPVTNKIGYYSYGYSLLLIPVRLLGMLFDWRWNELYHAGIVLNALLLILSFFLADRIAERFMPDMNPYVRMAACFVIFAYPSTIVYAHITWSECTLFAFVWIFLYLMMRIIDAPGILNHIAYAAVAFYLYAVHQRSVGILVSSVLVVLYLRLLQRNTMRQSFAYFMTLYGEYLIHTMFKKHVQNINYLGQESGGMRQILGYVCNKRSLLILMVLLAFFLFSYCYKKNRKRALQVFAVAVLVSLVFLAGTGIWSKGAAEADGAGFIDRLLDQMKNDGGQLRISNNDFAGQIYKLQNLFTKNGLIRLGVSIAGKWFYMTSGSALVVSWSVAALLINLAILFWKHIKQPFVMNRKKCSAASYLVAAMSDDEWRRRIWFLGMFFVWFSTFMISVIYKEGLFKNDDLVNGRYIDSVLGFMLVYGLYCLLKDRFFIISGAFFMGVYLAAGWLCKDILEKLQRTTFELAHCVLFGRVIWNYNPPIDRIDIIVKYVVRISIVFILLVRLLNRADKVHCSDASGTEQGRKRLFACISALRIIIALVIPFCAWGYIGKAVVDNYVVVRNEKQEEPFVQISEWVKMLKVEEMPVPVYYLLDYANSRYDGAIQFMLPDDTVIPIWSKDCLFDEDAFYIVRNTILEDPRIIESCETAYGARGYSLLIKKGGRLAEELEIFR